MRKLHSNVPTKKDKKGKREEKARKAWPHGSVTYSNVQVELESTPHDSMKLQVLRHMQCHL